MILLFSEKYDWLYRFPFVSEYIFIELSKIYPSEILDWVQYTSSAMLYVPHSEIDL